jgi:ADP-ribose pyrophosphatase YjhB (NUDIX family)
MTKAYVVLYDANNVYYPVKASTNPYNGKSTYCAGSPQFFGGKVNYDEINQDAVLRETAEESALTYLLENQPMTQVLQAKVGQKDSAEDYFFYMSADWSKSTDHKWPSTDDAWDGYPPEFREMCCIVSAPINTLISALGLTKGQEPEVAPWDLPTLPALATALVNAALAGAPSWAKPMIKTVPSEDFLNSETLNAFACFVVNCL